MTSLFALIVFVALLGLLCALLGAVCTRERRSGLPMLLELLTAAALLHLSVRRAWPAIAVLAVLVALRALRHVRTRSGARAPASP